MDKHFHLDFLLSDFVLVDLIGYLTFVILRGKHHEYLPLYCVLHEVEQFLSSNANNDNLGHVETLVFI